MKTSNTDLTKVLKEKVFRSAFVYTTRPFALGNKITIEGQGNQTYSGTVTDINLLYVRLHDYKREIYIPTSFIYDKIIYKHK